ncbi:MAG: AAA family ATPase [Chloroflexi bacterium]|nr:AAA family ATPase [Chloroflexota bacterium]
MPITAFDINNVKAIRKASCDNVPRLMIIAGRNGVGKSTLLYELRKFSAGKVNGSGKILYSGPHRTWRRRSIKTTWLWGAERDYSSILSTEELPAFEGIGFTDRQRRADGTDEAQGLIKYILAQIETRRQNAIVSEIDRNNLKYPEGYAPDIYKPLRDMLAILLPHLEFMSIDQNNRENVRCLVKVGGAKEPIDIDDLSSGEKEIIALFMPLLERQINNAIRKMQRGHEIDIDKTPDTVIVLDEPDLHIHPELQRRILDYIRKRAYEDGVQFIIATHSPVIINGASSDELFSLISNETSGNDNQLRKVATSQEKLNLFKDICGDLAILTLGRPIVFIEGERPSELKNNPSDQRILELLWRDSKEFLFIPMGGKEEVHKATLLLNQIISEKFVGLPVYAIVDADLNIDTSGEFSDMIKKWDFCTIENALLNPAMICDVLEPYKEKTGISHVENVEKELLAICRDRLDIEIDRRIKRCLPTVHLQFKGRTTEDLMKERESAIQELKNLFSNQKEIIPRIGMITKQVQEMIDNKTAFQKFDGKAILGKFYQKMVREKGILMGFDVFCYSIAERIGKENRTPESIITVLTSIKQNLSTQSARRDT